jgi:hypothetical protein
MENIAQSLKSLLRKKNFINFINRPTGRQRLRLRNFQLEIYVKIFMK